MHSMKEFIEQDGKILLNVPYAEAYISRKLFKSNDEDKETASAVAIQYGEGFKLVGLFNIRFFESEDVPRTSVKLRTFSYPNMIMTYPSDFSIERLALREYDRPEPYVVMKYQMGDVIMMAEEVQQVSNCTKFLNMITRGKIPSTIPYDRFENIWQKNFEINAFNPQVPSVVLQLIWSEMCRDPEDMSRPFRMVYGKGNADPTSYLETNMNNVAAATSVFSALSFERSKEKLASSINMSLTGQEQRKSPVEEVLSM